MNGKVLAIVAVAVVVVAAAGAGAFFLLKDKDKEPDTDYKLLDSNDNIKAGLTIEERSEGDSSSYKGKTVVTSVDAGIVKYTEEWSSKTSSYGETIYDLSDFVPGGPEVPFDYTGSTYPSGITVDKDGNVYTIKGTTEVNNPPFKVKYTYDDLKIEYNGAVISVNGGIEMVNDMATGKTDYNMDFKTENSKLLAKADMEYSGTDQCAVDAFYSAVLEKFDQSEYPGATITSDDGTFKGVDVKVYTLNGGTHAFKDMKIDVYNGYIIHTDGEAEGESGSMTAYIYMA